ncbi:MAG: adenylyltransferase/cytidyltransferase family protein [Verrucomicrobiota bacterium]
MNHVLVSSAFDDLRSRDLRFLQEAARFGEVHALLETDAAVCARTGRPPRFPYAERLYFLQAVRFVQAVHPYGGASSLPPLGFPPDLWVLREADNVAARQAAAQSGIAWRVLPEAQLDGFPAPGIRPSSGRKKVVVTGCYDWLHTGHIAFFEEVAALGDVYVCLGNDANIRELKGEGHPLFKASERLFVTGAIRHVTEALVSTGRGWMDAEQEILHHIRADIYAVNEDGDKPEKAAFCRRHGIQYAVLRRTPKAGLAPRSSTLLRGF